MYDIVAIGELLIDFTPLKGSENAAFEQNAGGAPANVLAAASGMGKRTCFIGKVGDDSFGRFLRDELTKRGVETSGLILSKEFNTTLAFVHLATDGERSFSFYRNPGADMMLAESEIDLHLVRQTRLLHFGSVSMTHDPARKATLHAVQAARESRAIVSFDPNVRLPLWQSAEQARAGILAAMPYVDVLKVSEEELAFLTDCNDIDEGTAVLFRDFAIALILVTMGPNGCVFKSRSFDGVVPSFPVKAVDTTGAGDSFMGAFLGGLVETGKLPQELIGDEISSLVRFANACGALATTRRGGMPSLPTKVEALAFMDSVRM